MQHFRIWMLGALLISAAALEASSATFPGVTELGSPDGSFVIRYLDQAPGTQESHEVRLIDRRTGRSCWALTFERSVDVLWSPTGRALAVTDWAGSNLADLVVILPADACRRVSLPEELASSLGEAALPKEPNHIYFEAKRWRSADVLEFRVWGDVGVNSRQEFDQTFEYTLDGKVRRAKTP